MGGVGEKGLLLDVIESVKGRLDNDTQFPCLRLSHLQVESVWAHLRCKSHANKKSITTIFLEVESRSVSKRRLRAISSTHYTSCLVISSSMSPHYRQR